MTVPPRPDTNPPAGCSWLSVLLATIVFSILAAGLIFLSGGMFLWVFAIGGGIFAVTVLHYLIWGWWLGKMIREEADDEDLG